MIGGSEWEWEWDSVWRARGEAWESWGEGAREGEVVQMIVRSEGVGEGRDNRARMIVVKKGKSLVWDPRVREWGFAMRVNPRVPRQDMLVHVT